MDLSLKIARPAEGTPIPETLAELFELLAQNTQVLGPQISEGSGALPIQVYRRQGDQETELTGEDSAIWVETNAENRPIALKLFWADAWHNFGDIPRGTTAERAALSNIGDWEQYYDTDLKTLLVYDPDWGKWVTMEGSPGDIKAVHAVDEAAAVAANPGWIIYEAARGSVLIGVDPDSNEDFSFTGIEDETEQLLRLPGRVLGKHTTTIRTDELPPHKFSHWKNEFYNRFIEDGTEIIGLGHYNIPTVEETETIGLGNPLDIRQKSLTVFYLIKANTDQPTVTNSERNGIALPIRTSITLADIPHQDELNAARLILGIHRIFVENHKQMLFEFFTIEEIYDEFDSDPNSARRIIFACKAILDAAFQHGSVKIGSGVDEKVIQLTFPLADISGDVSSALNGEPTGILEYNHATYVVQTTEFTDAKALIRNSTFYIAP